MGLADDITNSVNAVVNADWNIRVGQVVPNTEDITLTNGGVKLDAVYLYADLADSTGLARDFSKETAAKVVKAYLAGICRVTRARGGAIRSFDGDRIMAIFVGKTKNTDAAKCALQINHAVTKIVRPAVERRLPSITSKGFVVAHCVGVASGEALVVRGGVRNNSDLVSIGRSPNVAAKLSDIRNSPYHSYITATVYNHMLDSSKFGGRDDKPMWEGVSRKVGGTELNLYRSKWTWSP